jgi:hypothetical protein
MQEEGVFDEGYDSDGYIGPPRGTDESELEALQEESVIHSAPPTVETVAEEDEDAAQEQPAHVPMTEEEIKSLTIPLLKEELRLRRVPFKASLKKDGLVEKLREALAQQSPKYTQEQLDALGGGVGDKKKKEDDMTAFRVGAWWRELKAMDEQVDEPANEQFPEARAPTIPEDQRQVPLKPKHNYAEKWDRPPFQGSAHGKERLKGRANDAFLKAHNLDQHSSPVEFAEAFIPMFKAKTAMKPNPKKDPVIDVQNQHGRHFSMEEAARVTNIRAERAFVGEATYKNKWEGPFSVKEIRQWLGLWVLNGISPSPSLDKKFDRNDMANFNPFVNSNFVAGSPVTRLKIFRAYFGMQDPDKPVPERKSSPLFKVLPIIKLIRKISPLAWDCGKNVAVDEQTISMTGHHADKMRITYKRAGDGFQCDAICDDGFTFSIYFRNEPPPAKYTSMGLSPLHSRVMWLFDQLKDKGHRCRVDNLYMSCRFAKFCWTRKGGRGVPQLVCQEEVIKKSIEATVRGTVKAAVLEGDPDCPNLVAVSVYDTKPVHFISMVSECIEWITKSRKMWNKAVQALVSVEFLRLNINDDYNREMNDVDIFDHLRTIYEFDHWLRNRKWWWAIFLYAMGVLLTNAYLVYCSVMDEAGVERKLRKTHYEFLLDVATSWIDLQETDIREVAKASGKRIKRACDAAVDMPDTMITATNSLTMASSINSANDDKSTRRLQRSWPEAISPTVATKSPARKRARITPRQLSTPSSSVASPKEGLQCFYVKDSALDPDKGVLKDRLDHFGIFHCPEPKKKDSARCALHRWLKREWQLQEGVVCCSHCGVHLCVPCFKLFHKQRDLVQNKETLTAEFADRWKERSRKQP